MIPDHKLQEAILWAHRSNGHPGAQRTSWFFLKNVYCNLTRQELILRSRTILSSCNICLRTKPNNAPERGLIGALPIPQVSNDIIFVDFIKMDDVNNFNYVLTIVDGLTRFVKFCPCKNTITGEGTLKVILTEWIQNFGKPQQILSDNDVRFAQQKGFYQSGFKALGVDINFGLLRHPQSNGLCERVNRPFLQNVRALSLEMNTMEWPKLCPLVSWIMNSQISSNTGYSPSELFLGKPSWKFQTFPEPATNPLVKNWLEEQMMLQEIAIKRLEKLRESGLKKRNKGRSKSSYQKNDYVLVHKDRWPQNKVPKLESPWLGPYKVVQVHFNSLSILASPHFGCLCKVSLSQVKKWTDVWDINMEIQAPEAILEEEVDQEAILDQEIPEKEPEPELFNEEEMQEQGFYNVEAILKHKFQQGWIFLTKWEGYPMDASTWEPIKAFKIGDGRVNGIFLKYCQDHSLEGILKKIQ